ncbi:MAG: pre-peptidase C-terminal domain-containing protein [Verrucomicrobia bacterium]|nr:pre-peptidase C-terminal domain-containing protein [Verrucomicrobiota bacterium]
MLARAFSLRFRSANACFFAAWLVSNSADAAAPVLDHLFPAAVQVGTTNVVTAVGKFDPWPAKIWVDAPGIVFKAETNSGKFSVEVAADAPVGGHLVRLYNEQGVSGLRFLVVTKERQTEEVEPNNEFKKPQMIDAFPAFINGRLEKSGDVDSYAVALEVGQTLVASVEAYTLASPVDAVLRVVDARGVQVAWNHDGGPTLDPFLTWTAKSAGTYVVQVFGFGYPADSSVNFVGNAKCVYRLHLSRGPYVNHTVPLGVPRGRKRTLELVGWNLPAPASVEFDATTVAGDRSEARL